MKRYNIKLVALEKVRAQRDFVSLHVRLNHDTRGMIGYDQLKQMKPTAFLSITSRRDLVVEKELDRALSDNCFVGAWLDDPPTDPERPILKHQNVAFTTHLGNRARVGVIAVFRCAVRNAADVLNGRECPFVVNLEVSYSQ